MSTIPKLALIPSGVKASKVYSVLPSNGVGDFDFTRLTIATRINKDGLIESVGNNVPRLNYPLIDGVVSGCPSLLLESTSTNLLTYSEDLTKSNWLKIRSSVSASEIISPNGTLNAITFNSNTSTSPTTFYAAQDISVSSGEDYTNSIFIKKGSSDFAYVQIVQRTSGYLGEASVVFQFSTEILGSILTNGTAPTNLSAKVEKYPNGWYRLSLFGTISGATTINRFAVGVCQSLTSTFYTATTNDSVYVWGAQAEQGYLTSYIPTISFTVTRSAETCNNAGDVNTFNDSEGVLMAEFSSFSDSTFKYITISDGSIQNRITIILLSNNNIYGQIRTANSEVFFRETSGISIEQNNKIAVHYKTNQCKLFVNGFQIGSTDTLAPMPSGLNTLAFDDGIGAGDFYGNTKQIQYFDTALTDSELETLTSWTSFNEMAISQQYSLY